MESAIEIAQRRLASGEISSDDFDRIVQRLQAGKPPGIPKKPEDLRTIVRSGNHSGSFRVEPKRESIREPVSTFYQPSVYLTALLGACLVLFFLHEFSPLGTHINSGLGAFVALIHGDDYFDPLSPESTDSQPELSPLSVADAAKELEQALLKDKSVQGTIPAPPQAFLAKATEPREIEVAANDTLVDGNSALYQAAVNDFFSLDEVAITEEPSPTADSRGVLDETRITSTAMEEEIVAPVQEETGTEPETLIGLIEDTEPEKQPAVQTKYEGVDHWVGLGLQAIREDNLFSPEDANALSFFDRAARIDAANPIVGDGVSRLADRVLSAALNSGDWERAVEDTERILRIFPDSGTASTVLEQSLKRLN